MRTPACSGTTFGSCLCVYTGAQMKRTRGKTTAAKEKYWEKIIEAARRYPQGITQYCRVMNVKKGNYYQWFKRLRAKHPEWHDLSNHPEV